MIYQSFNTINEIYKGNNIIYRTYLGGPYNLLKNTENRILPPLNTNFNYAIYILETPINADIGDKFAISVDNIKVLEGNPTLFTVLPYNIDEEKQYGTSIKLSENNLTGVTTITQKCIVKYILIYAGICGETAGNSIQIQNVMLVKGETAAPYWTPSIQEATNKSCMVFNKPLTYNLLLNSNFIHNTDSWELDSNVIIDTDKILDNRYSVKSSQSGLTNNGYFGIRQRLNIKLENTVTLSGYAMTDDITSLSTDVIPAYLEIIFFNANNERITQKYVNLNFQENNKWYYYYNSFSVPENTQYAIVVAFVTKNGTVWFNGIKLENGYNPYPEWSLSNSEI